MRSPDFSLDTVIRNICRNYLEHREEALSLSDQDQPSHEQAWGRLNSIINHTVRARFGPEIADNVMSAAYIIVTTKMADQFNFVSKPSSWVIQVAINEAHAEARLLKRVTPGLDDQQEEKPLWNEAEPVTPESCLEQVDERRRLGALINNYLRSDNQKRVLLMMLDDRADADIAAVLGLNEANVRLLRHRGLARLREIFSAQSETTSGRETSYSQKEGV